MIKNHRKAGIAACVATVLVVLALAFGAFTHASTQRTQWKPDPAVYALQMEFSAKHPAFTAPLGSKSLTVEQWEQAEQQCADAEDYAARFLTLAKAHPKTATAEQALWWIIGYCPEAPSAREAVELLARDYFGPLPRPMYRIDPACSAVRGPLFSSHHRKKSKPANARPGHAGPGAIPASRHA